VLHWLKGQHFLHKLFHESVRLLTDSKKNTEIKASLRVIKTAVFVYLTHIFLVLNSKARHLSPYAELTLSFWQTSSGGGWTRRITRVVLLLVLCVWWSMEERSYRRFEINYCRMTETFTDRETPHSIKLKSSSIKLPEPHMSRRRSCVQYN